MSPRVVASFVGLQLGWFACVLGGASGHPALGPAIVLPSLALHVWLQPAEARGREALVLAAASLLGFVIDTALLRTGVIVLADAKVSPPWLVALWPNFAAATAPAGSLAGLANRPLLGALLGAVAAPFAYDAGARLGAVALGGGRLPALAIIGAAWALFVPAFVALRYTLTDRRME